MIFLKTWRNTVLVLCICLQAFALKAQNGALVFQSDFGLKDGAVSAMKGVSYGVSDKLHLYDLTHEIPVFNIWEASYRLQQTLVYWPAGTVFVSVVDPGVGSARKSVVVKTKTGHFIVTPDNGTLTFINDFIGIDSIRQIDETKNRLKGSGDSYTFHGRDVYAYTGARLASGTIRFEEVGPLLPGPVQRLTYQLPSAGNGVVKGNIPILDIQYGNVWSNIPLKLLTENGIKYGDVITVKIFNKNALVYSGNVLFGTSFSAVAAGQPIAYINSLLNFAIAINTGSFAKTFAVSSGPEWSVEISKK
jgi:S-adenosylmethionine hydrolase